MSNDLIKRIDEAHFALFNGMNHEELDVLLRDCRAEIERLSKPYTPSVDALIAEAVAKEREACALVCETLWNTHTNGMATEEEAYGEQCAAAIRARGQK